MTLWCRIWDIPSALPCVLGANTPLGLLMYDAPGNMSAQLMKADLPRFASGDRLRGSDNEVRAVVEGSGAYYGQYVLDPSTTESRTR